MGADETAGGPAAPPAFIALCRALHDRTKFSIRTSGATSREYTATRGLKEGCPTSPPLFNLYHQAVLQDFRNRRKRKADQAGLHAGIPWRFRIDEKLVRRNAEKLMTKNFQVTVIGDIEFADDTATIATQAESGQADRLLEATFTDWGEKLNREKTELLQLQPNTAPERRQSDDPPPKVRHVGGHINAAGTQWADTIHRCITAKRRAKDIAKAWATGTAHGRGRTSRVKIATRLKVMRSVVVPTLTAFGRSRAWTKQQVEALQTVQTYAQQRCFGLDRLMVRDLRITTAALHKTSRACPHTDYRSKPYGAFDRTAVSGHTTQQDNTSGYKRRSKEPISTKCTGSSWRRTRKAHHGTQPSDGPSRKKG